MKDTLFKKSLRIWFRILWWIIKLIFSPIYVGLTLLLSLTSLFSMFVCWLKNNESDYNFNRRMFYDYLRDCVKWVTP